MRLAHHILLWVLVIVLTVFSISMSLHVRHARAYLGDQLVSHAQDTATALALSVSNNPHAWSEGALQSLVDATADAGYYQLIEFVDGMGHRLAGKDAEIRIAGVPAWFVSRVDLNSPVREAPVTNGWKVMGQVRVQSHPGYAYKRLWLDLRDQAVLLAGGGGILALISLLMIRFALRPLNALEAQARAVAEGEFRPIMIRPWTVDLKRITAAMNVMTLKVEAMLGDKVHAMQGLESRLLRDAVTGLFSREHFAASAQNLLLRAPAHQCHALVIVRLTGLAEYNRRAGFDAGTRLLAKAGDAMRAWAAGFDEPLIGRCAGDQIALFGPALSEQDVKEPCMRLLSLMAGLGARGGADAIRSVHIGAALQCGGAASLKDFFASADLALRRAESDTLAGCHVYGPGTLPPMLTCGAAAWGERIREALRTGGVVLRREPAIRIQGKSTMQESVMADIAAPDGSLVTAEVYLPMAQRLGLAGELDRAVLNSVISRCGMGQENSPRCAIELSGATLSAPALLDGLEQTLAAHASQRECMAFEVSEWVAQSHPHGVQQLRMLLRKWAIPFGMTHAGRDRRSFELIKALHPAYLKLHADFSSSVLLEQETLLEGLVQLAHALDCTVIATAVETDAQLAALSARGCDAAIGKLFGEPRPFDIQ